MNDVLDRVIEQFRPEGQGSRASAPYASPLPGLRERLIEADVQDAGLGDVEIVDDESDRGVLTNRTVDAVEECSERLVTHHPVGRRRQMSRRLEHRDRLHRRRIELPAEVGTDCTLDRER